MTSKKDHSRVLHALRHRGLGGSFAVSLLGLGAALGLACFWRSASLSANSRLGFALASISFAFQFFFSILFLLFALCSSLLPFCVLRRLLFCFQPLSQCFLFIFSCCFLNSSALLRLVSAAFNLSSASCLLTWSPGSM